MFNNNPPQYDNYNGQPNFGNNMDVNTIGMPQMQRVNQAPIMIFQAGNQQQQQQPFQQTIPIGIIQVAPFHTTHHRRHVNSYQFNYVWAIINAIIFFPIFFFWVPALVYSIKSKNMVSTDLLASKKLGITSFLFNLVCTILGLLTYGVAATVIPIVIVSSLNPVVSLATKYSSCTYSYALNYYMCYSYQSGCVYSNLDGYYICN